MSDLPHNTATLPRIKAALEAKREARAVWDAHADAGSRGGEYNSIDEALDEAAFQLDGLLTDDTIAAFVAVAEAAKQAHYRLQHHSAAYDAMRILAAALAPLVKEVPDDRA